ncbi:MAG: ABC transporter permease [Anaerolineae bacterium]|nr:ABC transporter permease [Anaerolineae bacterium]
MDRLWTIATHEYRRHVLRRGFLIPLLIVPALVAIAIAVTALGDALRPDRVDRIGYVDPVGYVTESIAARAAAEGGIQWVAYPDADAAQRALAAEEISAYYLLSADSASRQVEVVYADAPRTAATRQMQDMLRLRLLSEQPAEVVHRVTQGSTTVVRLPGAASGSAREFHGAPTIGQLLPVLSGFVLVVLTFISSGYAIGALADEKQDRTIEILLTSTSPAQLMIGKVLGIVGIALTQLAVWSVLSGLLVIGSAQLFDLAWAQDLRADPRALLVALAVSAPSYVLTAAFMTAIAATIAETRVSQQIAWVAITLYMTPLPFIVPMMRNLNSPVIATLSIVPLLAPVVLPLRVAFAQVPAWQVGASIAVQVVCALGALLLAGRALRLGALRYGRRIRWREILGGEPATPREEPLSRGASPRGARAGRTTGRAVRPKIAVILRHELVTMVTKPLFLLMCVGLPLLVFGQLALMTRATDSTPAARADASGGDVSTPAPEVQGVVDQSGLLAALPASIPGDVLVPYADQAQASQALAAGEIGAYWLVPPDYLSSGELICVRPDYSPEAFVGASSAIEWALQVSLLGGDTALAAQVRAPAALNQRAWTSQAASEEEEGLMRLVPMLLSLLVYAVILMSSGLLLRSVSDEKKNRVIEILLISVHPRQLLAGKIAGLGIAGLIQALVWTVLGILLFTWTGGGVELPDSLALSPAVIAWMVVFSVLGYGVYATLYAGAGALVEDWRRATSASFVLALPVLVGFEIALFTTDNPHGTLSVLTSLFPLTAPTIMIKRLVVGGVPWWQPWASAGIMALTIPLIVRGVARMFRAQYLLSGQPWSIRRYLRVLLGRA